MGRNKEYVISLTDDEVRRLKSVLRKKTTTWTIKCRCQILLGLDEEHGKSSTHQQCVKFIGVCFATVHNVIKYYIDDGVENVLTVGKSINSDNARRKVDGRVEAKLIEMACGPTQKAVPDGHFAFWKRKQKLNLKFRLARMPSEEP